MRILFDGRFWLTYAQACVQSQEDWVWAGHDQATAGQQGGLCGAAIPGYLYLVTGLHTGEVAVRVVLHHVEPPVDDEWEDVVEVSFRPRSSLVHLAGLEGEGAPLDLPVADYRVRYSARGMDAARDADTTLDGEAPVDHYELALWPAPPRPDVVLRETSATAGYWHRAARGEPEPEPPPLTPEAEAAREAAARVSSAAIDGAVRSGALSAVELTTDLPAMTADDLAFVTGLSWIAGNGWSGTADRPGDELSLYGFGHGGLQLHVRRLEPGRRVEVAWDLDDSRGRVVETGSTLRLDLTDDGRTLTVRHDVPVEWASDVRLVWTGLLAKLRQHWAEPGSYALGHWDLGQEPDLPELPDWDPRDDATHVPERDAHEGGWEVHALHDDGFRSPLAELDPFLVDAVFAMTDDRRRDVALWATRQAWREAGIDTWPGAAAAFAAVERGERPAPPYDDVRAVLARVDEQCGTGDVGVLTLTALDGRPPFPYGEVHGPSYAAPLLPQLVDDGDPLRLALDALTVAVEVFGPERYPLLLGGVRDAFPELG